MVYLNSITTKQGDGGLTMLGNGDFVSKADPRIEAYGTVDEAGAFIGLAVAEIDDETLKTLLKKIQQHLFNLGSVLCRPYQQDKPPRYPMTQNNVDFLESQIAAYNQPLPALESFILSGGTQSSARLHVARTIVRRAERKVILLSQLETVPAMVVIYLNRLSDLLFILARTCNHLGKNDILWQPDTQDE